MPYKMENRLKLNLSLVTSDSILVGFTVFNKDSTLVPVKSVKTESLANETKVCFQEFSVLAGQIACFFKLQTGYCYKLLRFHRIYWTKYGKICKNKIVRVWKNIKF